MGPNGDCRRHPSVPWPGEDPNFFAFTAWLSEKGYSHYLNFRSRMGADYDAELWYDQEFKQTWRR